MLIVLTDGDLVWDEDQGDFDWQRTTALPRDVQKKFANVPLYVDLRWAHTVDHLSLQHPQFRSAVLDLAAPLHGKPKDELGGEDVRQYRRTRRLVRGVIALLVLLAAGASVAAYVAVQQRNRAESRALAAIAILQLRFDPEQSVVWATQAMKTAPTAEAEEALRESLFTSRVRTKIHLPDQRHDHPTWKVAFTADSTHVVATDERHGTVKVVNLETNKKDSRIRSVTGRAFTNGSRVLTISHDGKAQVWDVASGEVIRILAEDLHHLIHAAFSPDGTRVFTNDRAQPGTIWALDTDTRSNLSDGMGLVTQAVFSPDNQFLITLSADGRARLWDTTTGRFIRDLPGHTSSHSQEITDVTVVQFSPNGHYVATACGFGAGCYLAHGTDQDGNGIADFDGTVRIWQKAGHTFELLRELPGEGTDRVYGLAFDPRSEFIATARGDNVAHVWKISGGGSVSTFTNHTNWVWSAAFNPDSTLVVTTGAHDETARVWEPTPRGRELLVLRGHQSFVGSAVFSPNDKFMLTIGDDETARVWELNAGQPVEQLDVARVQTSTHGLDRSIAAKVEDSRCTAGQRRQCWTRAVSSLDQTLVVTFNHEEQSYTTAKVWQAKTGKLVRALDKYKDGIRYAVFSNDRTFVMLIGAFGNTVEVWRVTTGDKVSLIGHTGRIRHATFSPNNACIVTGSFDGADGTVRVWQTSTGSGVTVLWGYRQGVAAVTFDPKSTAILVLDHEKTVYRHAADGCASLEDLLPLAEKYVENSDQWH
jgi:WD40 repeat protein